jgi:hypothetical protein
MAFCTRCGAQIPDGAKFCTSCGAPVAAPAANPTPRPASRPAQTAPRATTTPQGGIVIDAPPGSTVNISDAPPKFSETAVPADKGEFTLITWDEKPSPAPRQPQYQQPQQSYRQPQPPPQPQQSYRQPQYPQQPYQQAAPAPAPEKKKKRPLWVWILVILLGVVILAMKLGW